ncbi:MAG TPA: RecX family transcriptional regulator [Candidatus Saccharimonadales bacterium]|nr:RecX family transcriptional regulator [Candidatus Saccharimonadales bacterium]
MKITKITAQVKVPGRYSVFVDDKYAFSLSDTALLDSKLVPGQELTEEELKHWKQASLDDKLLGRALQYAMIRPRSRWEMEQYLQRKKAPSALANSILNKLSILGMLNDVDFARSWVANRRLLRPTSKRKLQQELRAKRVPDEVIERVLTEDETDEQTVLKDLIAKKRQTTRYKNDDLKLMQYLARQGFSYSDIKNALEAEEG